MNPMNTQEALKGLTMFDKNCMYSKLGTNVRHNDPMDPLMEFIDQVGVPYYSMHGIRSLKSEFESTPMRWPSWQGLSNVNIIMAHPMAQFKGMLDVAPYMNIYVDVSGGNPEAG